MAYCDVYDIAGELKLMHFSTTTKPTVVEVEEKCASVSIEMDAVFSAAGVVLPLVTTPQLSIAEGIAVLGTCARVLRSVETKPELVKAYQDQYDKKLEMIRKTPAILSAPVTPTPDSPGASLMRGDPKFQRGQQQW
jgi:hypothetical protein